MAERKRLKVWLHISKSDADYTRCNICDTKCKASYGNTSNLRKHLVKHKVFLKADDCTVFDSLKVKATSPSISTPTASGSSSSAASIGAEEVGLTFNDDDGD
ncbi:hypothetical protein ABVT39_012723 [Epinephelus coioides]